MYQMFESYIFLAKESKISLAISLTYGKHSQANSGSFKPWID